MRRFTKHIILHDSSITLWYNCNRLRKWDKLHWTVIETINSILEFDIFAAIRLLSES